MSKSINLRVITPLELVVDEQVEEVVVPGDLGEFGILPGHVPFVSTLSPGFLTFKKGSDTRSLIIHGGLAEVSSDNVRILTDVTEEPGSVDRTAAKKDLEYLEEQLKEHFGNQKKLKDLNYKHKLAQVRVSAK
ncbi:MAG: ATP synthase F1 subunit epsilon [Thermodesulfobacteriota bacterium]